eukprot:1158731-Pelagomonas_calceolata.AAC.2
MIGKLTKETINLTARAAKAPLTSEGSVASNAKKLAKPVLPDTEVVLICSAWGNNRTCLQQAMPYNQQQIKHQRLPHQHTRAGGAGPAPDRISRFLSNFCALTSHLAVHATPQAGMVQLDCKVPGTGIPGVQTQQGHPQKYSDEIYVDWSCSGGLYGSNWPAPLSCPT